MAKPAGFKSTPEDGDLLTNLVPDYPEFTGMSPISHDRLGRIKVGTLFVPPEQRDILATHRGLDSKYDDRLLGTITVLQAEDENGTLRNYVVDGLQRASRTLVKYGPDAELPAVILTEADDLSADDSLWLFEAINQNVQLSPYDYFRSATRSGEGKHKGLKAVENVFLERDFRIAKKTSTAVTFTAVVPLAQFVGVDLKNISRDPKEDADGASLRALGNSLDMIATVWDDSVASLSQRLNPAIVLGVATVLRDAEYGSGKKLRQSDVKKFLESTSPAAIIRGTAMAKDTYLGDGTLKKEKKGAKTGATHGGGNEAAYGARFIVHSLNALRFISDPTFGNTVENTKSTPKLVANKIFLAGDRALAELRSEVVEEEPSE